MAKFDMSRKFLQILQRFMMHIIFGTDVNAELKITIMMRRSSLEEFKPKELHLSDAIDEIFE